MLVITEQIIYFIIDYYNKHNNMLEIIELINKVDKIYTNR
jgi:hypothetical protein